MTQNTSRAWPFTAADRFISLFRKDVEQIRTTPTREEKEAILEDFLTGMVAGARDGLVAVVTPSQN